MKKLLPAVWTALALAAAAALGLSAPTLVSRWTDRGMENAPRSVEIERVSLSYFDDTASVRVIRRIVRSPRSYTLPFTSDSASGEHVKACSNFLMALTSEAIQIHIHDVRSESEMAVLADGSIVLLRKIGLDFAVNFGIGYSECAALFSVEDESRAILSFTLESYDFPASACFLSKQEFEALYVRGEPEKADEKATLELIGRHLAAALQKNYGGGCVWSWNADGNAAVLQADDLTVSFPLDCSGHVLSLELP